MNSHDVTEVPNLENMDHYITTSEPLEILLDDSNKDKIYTIAVEPLFNHLVSYTIVYEAHKTIS